MDSWIIVLISIIFVVGCQSVIVCNSPYILVGQECCLDKDGNSICDTDEIVDQITNQELEQDIEPVIEIVPNISEKSDDIICNKPYMRIKDDCCLDKDDNSICDNDEIVEESIKEIKPISEVLNGVITIQSEYKENDEEYSIFGSGFVISSDGYVLTNHHIFEHANVGSEEHIITGITNTGIEYNLLYVASDSIYDVALLKIDSDLTEFEYLEFAENSGKSGDAVYAIGAPLGEQFSVTKGIISQKDRSSFDDGGLNKYLQTDTAINPGNSGGPIVNMNGDVVGLVTFKIVSIWVDNMGYALQSEELERIIEKEMYKGIVDIRGVRSDTLNQKSKEVIISNPNVRYSVVRDTKEVRFMGFEINIENKMDEEISLCFDLLLLTYRGLIDYNEKIDGLVKIKANSVQHEDFSSFLKYESSTVPTYYEIQVYDCNTNEEYTVLYGRGY